MSSLKEIAPRLAQLVRLLGSDKDGEVAAVVGAMQRTLTSVDLSFHEMANLIEQVAAPPPVTTMKHASKPGQCEAADVLSRYFNLLSEWDRKFLGNVLRWRGSLTEKQQSKLREILDRVDSHQRRAAA